jgi:hypothetical protein
MPSRVSLARRRKAFDEGRRAATDSLAKNPYANAALKKLWETGLKLQKAGEIKFPIPPLSPGKRRAATPMPKRTSPPQRGGGYGGGYGGGGGGYGGRGGDRPQSGNYRRPGGPPPRSGPPRSGPPRSGPPRSGPPRDGNGPSRSSW